MLRHVAAASGARLLSWTGIGDLGNRAVDLAARGRLPQEAVGFTQLTGTCLDREL